MFLIYPPVNSDEFCDLHYENHFPEESLLDIMETEINKDSNIQYFLSHFPLASYRQTGSEDSFPGRFSSMYIFGDETITTKLDFSFRSCRVEPHLTQFYYNNDNTDTNVSRYIQLENYDSIPEDSLVFEITRDIVLNQTHQKWINIKNNTVYVYPESSNLLSERGYLIEQKEFFDFDKS